MNCDHRWRSGSGSDDSDRVYAECSTRGCGARLYYDTATAEVKAHLLANVAHFVAYGDGDDADNDRAELDRWFPGNWKLDPVDVRAVRKRIAADRKQEREDAGDEDEDDE